MRFFGIGDVLRGISDKVVVFSKEPKEAFDGLELVVLMGYAVRLPLEVDLLVKMYLIVADGVFCDGCYLLDVVFSEIPKEAVKREDMAVDRALCIAQDCQMLTVFVSERLKVCHCFGHCFCNGL